MTLATVSLEAYDCGTKLLAYGYMPAAVDLTVVSATPVAIAMSDTVGKALDLGMRDIIRIIAEATDIGVLLSHGLVPPPICLQM